MENKKERTAPNVSVAADTEQPLFKNTENSISEYEENIKSFEEMQKELLLSLDPSYLKTISMSELFYPQLGVKLCSMAGGGVQKIYMVFLREPSRRDRSGSDLSHLWDGFEIKMNFDRNVSCFIFVNALMHDDFFD